MLNQLRDFVLDQKYYFADDFEVIQDEFDCQVDCNWFRMKLVAI
jgi:hypothetical protein